jgi:hypothetical protein
MAYNLPLHPTPSYLPSFRNAPAQQVLHMPNLLKITYHPPKRYYDFKKGRNSGSRYHLFYTKNLHTAINTTIKDNYFKRHPYCKW